jgi:hypothetical protein
VDEASKGLVARAEWEAGRVSVSITLDGRDITCGSQLPARTLEGKRISSYASSYSPRWLMALA